MGHWCFSSARRSNDKVNIDTVTLLGMPDEQIIPGSGPWSPRATRKPPASPDGQSALQQRPYRGELSRQPSIQSTAPSAAVECELHDISQKVYWHLSEDLSAFVCRSARWNIRAKSHVTVSHSWRIVFFVIEEMCFFVCIKQAVFVSEAWCIDLIALFLIC